MYKKGKNVGARLRPCPNNSGITLIALVITIIVMLILVAVTISMAVNGGLFDYAGKATGDTKNALNAEQQLGNGGVTVDGTYYNSIDEYLATKGNSSSGENTHNWTRTGYTFKCSHCNAEYIMGDVVDYTIAGKTSTVVTAEKNGAHFIEEGQRDYLMEDLNADGSQTIYAQDAIWIVLGIEDSNLDGSYETLLITTQRPVYANLDTSDGSEIGVFGWGRAWYNNMSGDDRDSGEANRICKELYSNSEYGEARCMTIEDVNNVFDYCPEGGMYHDSNIWDFVSAGNFNTPLKDLPGYDFSNMSSPDETKDLGDYLLDGYEYEIEETENGYSIYDYLSSNDGKEVTRREFKIIIPDRDQRYMLANRGVAGLNGTFSFGGGMVENGYAGPRVTKYGNGEFDSSYCSESASWRLLRPVVSLQSKLPDLNSDNFTFFLDGYELEASPHQTWADWVSQYGAQYGFSISAGENPRVMVVGGDGWVGYLNGVDIEELIVWEEEYFFTWE